MDNISAIIVAGGKGSRFSATQKKQFITLRNKEILAYSIEAFHKIAAISEIIVVCAPEDIDYVRNNICAKYSLDKVTKVIAGGKERQDSVYNALQVTTCEYVLIHDGVRPFITPQNILKAIETMLTKGSCVLGVPVKDTIKKCNPNTAEVLETVDRTMLYSIQTPQCFKTELIFHAHKYAKQSNICLTDDSALAELCGHKVFIVEGSYDNIKITTAEDLAVAENILQRRTLDS
ncbi:MAG: 2-C-methyl-D-erythritol 4-phosphate cytidylyltransferase [Epulopiscium sp. Nuni2H_MBin001]|nr:MAG: 2-C-methyl-D-erythritol 4-phosphate cytidylyltransferase [Epulopiscium sp. Nuni2H_MBin001]